MKTKKTIAVILVLIMAVTLWAACSKTADEQTSGETSAQTSEQIKSGKLTFCSISEVQFDEMVKQYTTSNIKTVYFDTLNSMLLALKAEQIDSMYLPYTVASYVVARNNDTMLRRVFTGTQTFSIAVKSDNTELLDELNSTISQIKSDGTMDTLIYQYIYATINGDDPQPAEIPQIAGAQTIKVAVTGDLPPLDYISADGKPAGFNVALLSEISKRLGKNIELVTIDSGARSTALAQGKVDAVFWMRGYIGDDGKLITRADVPEGITLTDYYYADAIYFVYLSK